MEKQLVIRCTSNQYDVITKIACEAEMTKSEIVRHLINQFEKRVSHVIYEVKESASK